MPLDAPASCGIETEGYCRGFWLRGPQSRGWWPFMAHVREKHPAWLLAGHWGHPDRDQCETCHPPPGTLRVD